MNYLPSLAPITTAMRNRLTAVTYEIPDVTITTKPLHKAREDKTNGNQINLYLYRVAVDAAWKKKSPILRQPGHSQSSTPMALNLYYLVTAYGRNDDDVLCHELLGKAMRCFHNPAILKTIELESVLSKDFYAHATENKQQHAEDIDGIRITPHPLPLEELTKLWSLFQTPYAISVAYQVSTVLVDALVASRQQGSLTQL